ncbi:aa3-type cytochrome c oxidase subunit IV [Tabrizicola piscis]|jgi:Bacterial aa3 type cytochrome c oxidase subunit IV|uniref:Aa3-type cytochrome c oxidase subunit IV n=1 Tax=Tabrizicola piscis TaxID=2494374 RepID=A0A3S8U6A7_9RHOB|nr:aa3-type cytochrome c oxidase subunit IV [Tabrizicola piscis]AZL59118.1 aa3-type cytochrome c oxidase subunit IV [Tabrizicola piscis]
MADHNPEHKHGSMDIRAQEKTFGGFIRMSVWVVAISIGILIFMALVNS